ncbi:MAG: NAD-dependent epimerase/dehydratase family protein [Terriglobia bacterium]|nr:NAD-dependent epimerase/dehydratase family protein [Terriglobia bacterium]
MAKVDRRILVTGSSGQIGSELVPVLRERYGPENVVACDIKPVDEGSGPFELADATNRDALENIIRKHNIGSIYHLVSILSATGEQNPSLAWSVNIESLRSVLDLAVRHQMEKVFWPSSIAAFGPHTPRIQTQQLTVMDPNTMYGITKVAGELLCNYYFVKYGLDVRCLRFPGIISWKTPPGGGTTDYAVAIFHDALREGRYQCFVSADTVLPMMYMPDAVRAVIEFMAASRSRLSTHLGYNLAAMSFSAEELAREIKRHLPNFVCTYRPDARQKIADSWPKSIDDSCSREEWGWRPEFDLGKTVADMLTNLRTLVVETAEARG